MTQKAEIEELRKLEVPFVVIDTPQVWLISLVACYYYLDLQLLQIRVCWNGAGAGRGQEVDARVCPTEDGHGHLQS